MYSCYMCGAGANVQSVKACVLHCKLHGNEPRLIFKCIETSCKLVFSGYTALMPHFYRHHSSTPTVNDDSVEFGEIILILVKDDFALHFLLRLHDAEFLSHYHSIKKDTVRLECRLVGELIDMCGLYHIT